MRTRTTIIVAIVAILLTPAIAAAAIPEPGSIGLRTLDSQGAIIGGVTVRIRLIEGNWPQATLDVVTENPGVVWNSVNTGLYEIVALDAGGEPIASTSLDLFVPSGAHDLLVVIVLPPPACAGDLDGSGDVGFGDILVIIGAWGPCGAPCPQDLSGNGAVDFADILEVIAAWGACG